jgi:hypothetical protein
MATFWRTFKHDGEFSPAQAWWWCTPFHSFYHHVQSCGVRSSWAGKYTPPFSSTLFSSVVSVTSPTPPLPHASTQSAFSFSLKIHQNWRGTPHLLYIHITQANPAHVLRLIEVQTASCSGTSVLILSSMGFLSFLNFLSPREDLQMLTFFLTTKKVQLEGHALIGRWC